MKHTATKVFLSFDEDEVYSRALGKEYGNDKSIVGVMGGSATGNIRAIHRYAANVIAVASPPGELDLSDEGRGLLERVTHDFMVLRQTTFPQDLTEEARQEIRQYHPNARFWNGFNRVANELARLGLIARTNTVRGDYLPTFLGLAHCQIGRVYEDEASLVTEFAKMRAISKLPR